MFVKINPSMEDCVFLLNEEWTVNELLILGASYKNVRSAYGIVNAEKIIKLIFSKRIETMDPDSLKEFFKFWRRCFKKEFDEKYDEYLG